MCRIILLGLITFIIIISSGPVTGAHNIPDAVMRARVAVREAYNNLSNETDPEIRCQNRTVDFKKSIANLMDIEKQLINLTRTLNKQRLETIINITCSSSFNSKAGQVICYNDAAAADYTDQCVKQLYGAKVNLNPNDKTKHTVEAKVKILQYLFTKSSTQENKLVILQREKLLKCLEKNEYNSWIIENIPKSDKNITQPTKQTITDEDSEKTTAVTFYIVTAIAVVIIIGVIAGVIVRRFKKQRDERTEAVEAIEFENKVTQDIIGQK